MISAISKLNVDDNNIITNNINNKVIIKIGNSLKQDRESSSFSFR